MIISQIAGSHFKLMLIETSPRYIILHLSILNLISFASKLAFFSVLLASLMLIVVWNLVASEI